MTITIILIILLIVDMFLILKGRGMMLRLARKLDEALKELEKNN